MNKLLLSLLIVFCSLSVSAQTLEESVQKGVEFHRNGQYTKAIKSYSNVLLKDSSRLNIWINRGMCYALSGNHKKSLEDLHYALSISANKAEILVLMGNVFSYDKQFRNAKNALQRALKSGAKFNFEDYFNLGTAYYFLGESMDSAILYLEISKNLKPELSLANNNLAWAYLDIDPEKSCFYFNEAYIKDTLDAVNINNLGYSHLLCGNLEVAYGFLEKAEKLDKKNSFIYRNFGLYYKLKDDKKLACKYMQKALNLNIVEVWGEGYIKELLDYCQE